MTKNEILVTRINNSDLKPVSANSGKTVLFQDEESDFSAILRISLRSGNAERSLVIEMDDMSVTS